MAGLVSVPMKLGTLVRRAASCGDGRLAKLVIWLAEN